MNHGRRYREEPSRPIPVWNGVLDHRERIGPAVWVFLWLLDAITEEKDGVGLVLGGAPVKAAKIAKGLAFDRWTVLQHLQMLESGRYLRRRRTAYGFVIEVLNSRKFGIWQAHKRSGESPHSDAKRSGVSQPQSEGKPTIRVEENPRNKEDAAVDAAITQQQPAALPNLEDSVWEFLQIFPCGPITFRALLESRWDSRNGEPKSVLIGETVDAWEAAERGKLRHTPQLFRALDKLRKNEKRASELGIVASEPIHTFKPEEIPA